MKNAENIVPERIKLGKSNMGKILHKAEVLTLQFLFFG